MMSAPTPPPSGQLNCLPTISFGEGCDWASLEYFMARTDLCYRVWYRRDGHIVHADIDNLSFDEGWMTAFHEGYDVDSPRKLVIGLDDIVHIQYQ
jgi:hypothetical protein